MQQDRLWEAVDGEWMDCLRKEPVEKLLQIPSGVVQDHWPASLKEYVLTLRSLCLPRDQADIQEAFPGVTVAPLNNVITQGMNTKKKHEIEVLAAVIGSVARRVGADTVVDVGSGQGYLAQVLSFEHELSVIAIDASSHHGSITDARAQRIEKYYAAKLCKSRLQDKCFSRPKTVTCQVLSTAMLKDVSSSLVQVDDFEKSTIIREQADGNSLEGTHGSRTPSSLKANDKSSLVLAGLHACGDLSVTMLRTFMECDEVKAVISIGCCYNLLSEDDIIEADNLCGFPVSKGAKSASIKMGKNARDLACQSSDRWRALGDAAGLHNFELHAFRASFQMVLFQYYPEIISRNPTIGRQGKAMRRQHNRRILESHADLADSAESFSQKNCSTWAKNRLLHEPYSYPESSNEESHAVDRYSMFVKFCKSGLDRLELNNSQDIEYFRVWKETEEFSELVGPYWTLRAALGPVLETLLLLDRLLYLQEQSNVLSQAVMVPLFDPVLSPRNVALIARKV
ncbi:S-adenosyl-L-methionine-dependent methyltransferases superfamily protein [Perilla frutescens var. hirtella]|uniref:S-adenosyl-L-methionine-dependent methyltransferases superfamily protein n=1 Tax=Perilla frutescens var. hirtella TaxID=608512 RepID=A0AAD4IWG1_PERFH|nr:S-adenosyl-L-methionine-dependent methyltransferases superfamily protein [Perilla frutescens var. hirtella]